MNNKIILILFITACGRGPAGKPGAPGENASIDVIDPCGDAPAVVDEVLVRLSNNEIFASYTDALNTRLVQVLPGNYTTTDGTGCSFTVNEDGSVIW